MRLLYVPINQKALDRLREIAILEKRRPQDQAAVLLEQSLGLRELHSQTGTALFSNEIEKAVAQK